MHKMVSKRSKRWVGGLVAIGALVPFVGPAIAGSASSLRASEIGVQQGVTMDPGEQIRRVDVEIVPRLESIVSSLRRLLERARSDRDVVRILCLNDKLNQADVALRAAKDRRDALKSAVDKSQKDKATHEYGMVMSYATTMDRLAVEAAQCVGEETAVVGTTQVKSTQEGNLPNEDNTQTSQGETGIQPPTCTSCSL